MRIALRAAVWSALWMVPRPAAAHIELLSPQARESEQKQGPCGRAGSVRGSQVTEVRSGSVVRVTWRESVDHPSHFRISFDAEGDDDFADPATADDRFTNETVLIDGISDEGGGTFSADVTLPDIECDHCTLQLIQVMYDKAPYAVGTNDLYYRCADLTLSRDVEASEPPPGPANEAVDAGLELSAESPSAPPSDTSAPSSQPATRTDASEPPPEPRATTCSAVPGAPVGAGSFALLLALTALGLLRARRYEWATRART